MFLKETCMRPFFRLVPLILCLYCITATAGAGEDVFNFATGLFIEGDYELAAEEYSRFAQRYPDHPKAAEAYFRIGECMFRLEMYERALPAYKEAIERDAIDPGERAVAILRLGRVSAILGDYETAAGYYGSFAREFPEHAQWNEALYRAGESLFRAGRHAEASDAFSAAVDKNRGTRYEPYSLHGLGCVLQAGESFEEAAEVFREILEKFPDDAPAPEAALRLGQCLDRSGDYDGALKAYASMRRRYPDHFGAESLMGMALAYHRAGEAEKALEHFLRVESEYPESRHARPAAYNAAGVAFSLGLYEQAWRKYAAIAAGGGEYADGAAYWRAVCLLELERADEALEAFESIAEKRGEYAPQALFGRGRALRSLGELGAAQTAYLHAAERYPLHDIADEALYAAGEAAAESGDYAESVAIAGRLIADYEDSPLRHAASFLMAGALMHRGEYERAKTKFTELLSAEQYVIGDDALLYNIAWADRRMGEPEAAADSFLRVAGEYPDGEFAAESLYMAGRLKLEMGSTDEALALFRRCIEEHPGDESSERSTYALALAMFNSNRLEEASEVLQGFISDFPDSERIPDALFYRGECFFGMGFYDRAADFYGKVTRDYPRHRLAPEAAYARGWCARNMGEQAAAIDIFTDAARSYPGDAAAGRALYRAARIMIGEGRWEEAYETLDAAASAEGGADMRDEISYYMAHCLLQKDRFEEAERALKAFLEDYKDSELRHAALYDLAWSYRALGREDEAVETFARVAEDSPAPGVRADAVFRLAEFHYSAGDYEAAARLYREVASMDHVDFADKVHYKLGWSLQNMDDYGGAYRAFMDASRTAREAEFAASAELRAGQMLLRLGEAEEAAAAFQSVAGNPHAAGQDSARARYEWAECLRAAGQWARAYELYVHLLGEEESFLPAFRLHYGKGVCALEIGAAEDAREAFLTVIAQTETPAAAMAQMGLGEICFRSGEYEQAAREFLKTYILYGYQEWRARGLLRAGEAFREAGDEDRAERYWRQLVDMFPDSEEARTAREILK